MFRLVIFSCLFMANFANSQRQLKPTEERIVGGNDTEITEVPYLVAVKYFGFQFCGGTIIGPKLILTAAHCVQRRYRNHFSIRAGSSLHNQGGQLIDVEEVIIHPEYNNRTNDYDAAILVLKDYLTAAEGIEIATLTNVEPKAGEMVLVSGWGNQKRNTTGLKLLQSVEVPVVSLKECKRLYRYFTVTDQMFCAGYLSGGKDSCKGDSGGPAIVKGYLSGIVSWGIGCAEKDSPGVYTTVASILDWIMVTIQPHLI